MEENGIKVNTNIDTKKENEFNEKQNKIKEMLNYKYVAIKGALIGLIINSDTKKFIILIIIEINNKLQKPYISKRLPSNKSVIFNINIFING